MDELEAPWRTGWRPWVLSAVAQVVGLAAAAYLMVFAWLMAPEVGLWGVDNTGSERLVGAVAALAAGQAAVAGGTIAGLLLRRRSLVGAAVVGGVLLSLVGLAFVS